MTGIDTRVSAVVAAVEGSQALLRIDRPAAGCGRCHEPGGCGGGLVNVQRAGHPIEVRIHNSIGAAPGDRVLVEMSPGNLLKAVALTYGCATLCAILGAAVGTALFGSDGAAVIGAILGLVIGSLVSRRGEQQFGTHALLFARPTSNSTHPCHPEEI